MKPQSAKAKGRNLCKEVKSLVLKKFSGKLEDDDIIVTSSSANGEDLQFSPKARQLFPVSIECKNHAKYAIYKDYAQAVSNAKQWIPMLVIKQNHCRPLAVMDLEFFLSLTKG